MHTIHGNLLTLPEAGRFDVVVHGCNCRHTMGAGIAKQIRERWPEAWHADQRVKDPKLGGISIAVIAVALAACVIPVRNATRVDPLIALRTE